MKIALLGDSHAACLITAMNESADEFIEGTTTVFAAPGRNMENLFLEGARLMPSTKSLRQNLEKSSGGQWSIDIEAYDAFVLMGLRYIFPKLGAEFSSAVVQRVLAQSVATENHWRLVRLLRQVTDRPIFCGHKPLPSADPGEDSLGLIGYDDMFNHLKAATSDLDVTLLKQPAETRERGLFTVPEFAKGSRILKTGELHPDHDNRHMNSAFGAIFLANLKTALEAVELAA